MYYEQILDFLSKNLEKASTLEKDKELLFQAPGTPKISWEIKMAVVYRAEKKKILRNQIHLIAMVK